MKIEIKEKKENKLAGRLEIEGKLFFDGATPSNEVVRDMLAVELKADKELVVVKHIYSRFSYQEADFLAYVYDDKEMMGKMEVMTKHLRKKAEEAKKKAAEETKEETKTKEKAPEEKKEKVEEKTEEKAPEEKKKEAPKEAPAEEKKEETETKEEKAPEEKKGK